jgi:phosphatidylglycerophosphatase C
MKRNAGMTGPSSIAVFDLDGTLLFGDSFLPFLWTLAIRRRRYHKLSGIPLYCGLYACRVMSDYRAKERLIRAVCGGLPLATLVDHAEWFCNTWLPSRLRPSALRLLHRHQDEGRRIILLSASPDLYVPAIGQRLGITEVLCTEVAKENGRCAGTLLGENCKGPAKLRRLQAYLGADHAPQCSVAYGDQPHDMPVLQWVSEGYLLNKKTGEFEIALRRERSGGLAPELASARCTSTCS